MGVPVIAVASVVIQDGNGHLLVVRKRGKSTFQLPGGKRQPGETSIETIVREVKEELRLVLDPARLTGWGRYSAPAAHEPGYTLVSALFGYPYVEVSEYAAEIDEIRWIDVDDPGVPLTRMMSDVVVPRVLQRRVHG